MDITATLISQMIVFTSFVALTRRYIWPPLIEIIIKRQEEIAQGVLDAKNGTTLLQDAARERDEILRQAKRSHHDIIQQAQAASEDILTDAREEAEKILQAKIAASEIEIQKLTTQAQEGLEKTVISQVKQILERVMVNLPDEQQLMHMIDTAREEICEENQ